MSEYKMNLIDKSRPSYWEVCFSEQEKNKGNANLSPHDNHDIYYYAFHDDHDNLYANCPGEDIGG